MPSPPPGASRAAARCAACAACTARVHGRRAAAGWRQPPAGRRSADRSGRAAPVPTARGVAPSSFGLSSLGSASMPTARPGEGGVADGGAAPPAMPKPTNLGKGGLGKLGMGLDLSRVQQVIDNGDMEPNELTNKAEKLRYYNVRCSKVSRFCTLDRTP